MQWNNEEVDKRLSDIMKGIHKKGARFGERDGFINYVDGANAAGSRKVAEGMAEERILRHSGQVQHPNGYPA